MKKQYIIIISLLLILQTFMGCFRSNNIVNNNSNINEKYTIACNTPFGKYPETITYTLGKISGSNNSNMPIGDTYEDNAYTRYLLEKLNIQNKDVFEAEDGSYSDMVTMAISSGNIPDVMLVNDYSHLKVLIENDMIEDLTDVYKKCTSDRIKDIYKGYDSEILENVTFNGKLMALPETNIENGPNMLWLRKDWMDKLGLHDPKTLKDAENIIKEFIDKDPGNNGIGNTIGLACAPELTSDRGYSYIAQADTIFSNFKAYPKQWIKDSNGNISYGSILPEAKNALQYMNKLYTAGILDNKFLLRTQNNIQEIITNGQCGSFFGLWWAPNNPLMESLQNNKDANWQPYLISTDTNGYTSFSTQNPSCKYIVVRKGYEHPEIVMKISSVLFDYFNCNNESVNEIKQSYINNVDPTARPLNINIDYEDALVKGYKNIINALEGKIDPNTLQLIEYSYYEQVLRYIKDTKNSSVEDWAAYTSRITACSLLDESKLKKVKTYYHNKQTSTMTNVWWKLKELEKQTYLKIITGEEPIDYFDIFVNNWLDEGGKTITEEVRNEIKNSKGNE